MCSEKNLSVSLIFTPTSAFVRRWFNIGSTSGFERAVVTGQRIYKT